MSREELDRLKQELITLEDFQKFIDNNKIKSSIDFERRYNTIYNWALRKRISGNLIYYGRNETVNEILKSKEDIINSLNTSEDFEKFIEDNNITSPSDFLKRFRNIYIKSLTLEIKYKFITKEILVDKFKTLDDFNKFIEENKIVSSKDFLNRFNNIYYFMINLNLSARVTYFGSKSSQKTFNIKLLEETQQFVTDNKIKSRQEFKKNFRKIYDKFERDGSFKDITFYGKTPRKYFRTIEDFQEYIDKNKVENLMGFPEIIRSLLISYGYLNKIHFYNEFDSFEKCQDYIIKNKIKTHNELSKKHWKVYKSINKLGLISDLVYYGNTTSARKIRENKKNFNNLEDFQNLIDTMNYKCPSEFYEDNRSLFRRAKKLGISKDLIYSGRKRSKLEIEVESFLKRKGITNIITEWEDPILKNNKRLDIYLSDYNIAIECQGDQHFVPNEFFGGEKSFKRQLFLDKEKYNECKNAGIMVLYYINPSYVMNKEVFNVIPNYFAPIFTNIEELWNKISEFIDREP